MLHATSWAPCGARPVERILKPLVAPPLLAALLVAAPTLNPRIRQGSHVAFVSSFQPRMRVKRCQAQRGNHTSGAKSTGNKRELEGGQGSSGRSARHTRQTVGHLGPASSAISGVTLSQLVSSGLRVSNTCQAHSLPGCIGTGSIGALRCISVPERLRQHSGSRQHLKRILGLEEAIASLQGS
jgi:hypothetical protein